MISAVFPQTLSSQECPLLAKADPEACRNLLDRYNRAASFYHVLTQNCPEPGFVSGTASDFAQIAKRLQRRRYQIGFLGGFQAGKSTTFNRLLNVDDKPAEAPAKEGDSNATTAAVTRLYAVSDGEHRTFKHFMTHEEYLERRRHMGLKLQLAAENLDDPGADEKLRRLLLDMRREAAAKGEESIVSGCARMMRFLESFGAYHRKLADNESSRVIEPHAWADRGTILNHPDPKVVSAPAPTPLLESVVIEFRTGEIPPELEMIDLPGLGSINKMDDALTEQFIPKLDGALVFCRSDTVQDANVETFLNSLRSSFRGKLDGRVWVCYTKSDILNTGHFGVEKSFFHNAKAFCEDRGIPQQHICLICNKYDQMSPKFRSLDTLLNAPDLKPLAEAWEQLYADGGRDALRTIIKEKVPKLVGAGLIRQAEEDLKKIERDFVNAAQLELSDPAGDRNAVNKAIACLAAMSGLIADVERDTKWMRTQVLELEADLQEALKSLNADPQMLDQLDNLTRCFQQHAAGLEGELRHKARLEMIRHAYGAILPKVQHLEEQQTIRLAGVAANGLAKAWEEFQQADESSTAWYPQDFPSFQAFIPFENVAEDEFPLNGEQYVKLMNDKIRVVSRQLAQTLRRRVLARLRILRAAIDEFSQRGFSAQHKERSPEFSSDARRFAEACGLEFALPEGARG